MQYLMGIDLGSTSLKAAIYDLDGNLVFLGTRPTERTNPSADHPEWTVYEPEAIWQGAAAAIKEAVSRLADPAELKGVSVTGMGMDGVPVDAGGKWLYPFISWLDPRTEPQLKWWLDNIGAEATFAIGGNTMWYFCTALRILWMAEHEPELLKRTHKWVLIEDFLNLMLCGQFATDYTMASCTLLFDQRRLDWSTELLPRAGIDRSLLCDAKPSGTLLGEVSAGAAAITGLPTGTPVVLGGHDYLCGALPVGGFEPGVVLDVTGTWEIVLTATTEPILTPQVQQTGMTVEAHVARGKYAAWGGAVAAEMLEWYRREYGAEAKRQAEAAGGSEWDHLMEQAAQSPPGARGALFLPHSSGAGCPVVDARSLGAFVGLNAATTSSDMLRAVVEGLDYQFLDIVRAMEGALDTTMERFVAIGGAVRNEFWMQNKADMVGRPIGVPELEEATPLGAALLAGIGVGLYKDEQEAFGRVRRPGKLYEPVAKHTAKYAEWFEVYRQLYPALAPVSHRLFDASK